MIRLDHTIVPARDRKTAAKFLAEILDVPSGDAFGLFTAVYVNDSLTLDFADSDDTEIQHYCFSVSEQEFDLILSRLKERNIPYRSTPHGAVDNRINTAHGGRNLYWTGPHDGHYWEILTVSYARK